MLSPSEEQALEIMVEKLQFSLDIILVTIHYCRATNRPALEVANEMLKISSELDQFYLENPTKEV